MVASVFEKTNMWSEAQACVLAHHVSLCVCSNDQEAPLPPPHGSATFVRFKIDAGTVYGILTAAHVAKAIGQGRILGLLKPNNGHSISCWVTFAFIFCDADPGHFLGNSDEGYLPDLAFIALGLNTYPDHELFHNSKFFDLDASIEFGFTEDTGIFSVFFRGACGDSEIRADGCLETCFCIGGGEIVKYNTKKNIQYWKIPNTSKESINGASGAGFWRFRFEGSVFKKSLEGVITAETKSYIVAIAPPYLFDVFLDKLKKISTENFCLHS